MARAGTVIVGCSWASVGVFAVVAVPLALGAEVLDVPAIAVSLGLFLVSLPVWVAALVLAAARTTRGDDVTLGRLFLVDATASRFAQWQLYGALAASIAVAAATAVANPFGVLVPMLPLGLVGLWGARHGRYPPRAAYPRAGREGSG